MEGPIEFDIWCTVKSDAKQDVVKWVMDLHHISKLMASKIVFQSLKDDDYIAIYTELGFNDVGEITGKLPNFVKSFQVTESTYKPGKYLSHCERHKIYYASDVVCPVCAGFYVKTSKNGMKIV